MERKDLAKKSLVATAAASSFAVAAWLSFSQSGLPMPKASVMEHSPNPFSTSRGGTDGRTDTGSDAMREKPAPTEPERMRLNSAPPVEAYFFEERFWVFEIRGCGDGTVETPERPCREVPEPLAKAVSAAVGEFRKRVPGFDVNEFYRLFMAPGDSERRGSYDLSGVLLSPEDPVGSGKRLAEAYNSAAKAR